MLRDSAPVAYQLVAGRRVQVSTRYALEGSGAAARYGFSVGSGYRPDRTLVIDPGLAYSTYLGGASDEDGNGIAVDSAGNAYVTGVTQSPDFPTTTGAFRRTGSSATNSLDAYVTKLNPSGTALVYSTFLGAATSTSDATSRSTARGTPMSRVRRTRRPSPPRAPRSIRRSTSTPVRGAASTRPMGSSPS